MLDVTDLCKGFSGKKDPVLSDVCFSIQRGEVVALVGENGAGKTTLIRILAHILKPDKGSIYMDRTGYDVDPGYMKSRTGVLFSGDGALYDRLSARENIAYYARLNGMDNALYHHMLEMLVDELSLDGFLDDRVSGFSRGMKQRTALARTLVTDPEFVILDEPSTGLDIIAVDSVKRLIARLKKAGKAVLFSSHNCDEIFSSADRVIVVHKGKITCDKGIEDFPSRDADALTSYIRN